MFYTYILLSLKDGSHYIGQTYDLSRRLTEHNSGLSGYTKLHLPYKLLYYEEFLTRGEAMRREKFFKSFPGYCWLKENSIIAVLSRMEVMARSPSIPKGCIEEAEALGQKSKTQLASQLASF
jgi:putative endonuclease